MFSHHLSIDSDMLFPDPVKDGDDLKITIQKKNF